jgi:hypothetical protein
VSATHTCPSCKKRQVKQHQLACRPCWYRLPNALRQRLNNAFHNNPTDHPAALSACLDWYRDNPPATQQAHQPNGRAPEENFYEGSGR